MYSNRRVPRSIEIILLGDNIDSCKPGDDLEVTGIYMHRFDYMMNIKHGFPIFNVMIEANAIRKQDEIFNTNLPDEDKQEIRNFSKKPNVTQILRDSVAPSIYGHNHIKMSLLLSMFGGQSKDVQGNSLNQANTESGETSMSSF